MKRYAISIAAAAAISLGLQSCGDILGTAYAGRPLETDGPYWRVVREIGATGTGDARIRAAPSLMDADASGRLYLLDFDSGNEYARLKAFGSDGSLERALGLYSSVTNEVNDGPNQGVDIQWSGSETGLAASADGSQIFASSSNAPYLFHYAIASGTWDHRDTGNSDPEHITTVENPRTVRIASDGSVYLLNYDPEAYSNFIARFAYGSGVDDPPDARYVFTTNQDIVDFDIGPDGRIFALCGSEGCFYAFGADLASISAPIGSGYLFQPRKIAVDAEGYAQVVDSFGTSVATFAPDGRLVRRWGQSTGSALGRFGVPEGYYEGPLIPGAASRGALLYLSDYGNVRVQAFERVTQSLGSLSSVKGSTSPGRGVSWPITVKVRDTRGKPITGLMREAFDSEPSVPEAAWIDDVAETLDGSGAPTGDYVLSCKAPSSERFDLGIKVMGAEVGRLTGVLSVSIDYVSPLSLSYGTTYTTYLNFADASATDITVLDLTTSTDITGNADEYSYSLSGSSATMVFVGGGHGEETHVIRITFESGLYYDVTVSYHVT
jgi:hypothetical protein